MSVSKMNLLYEGKAKQVYQAEDQSKVIIHFKDALTAGNGLKKAELAQKGVLNAAISSMIFVYLMQKGIKTHYIKSLNERDHLCHKVDVILLEVIARNVATGSLTSRLGIKEGTLLTPPVIELCYKNDQLNDPLINDFHVTALGLANTAELAEIYNVIQLINRYLQALFMDINITLVDFKLEFGRIANGEIVLADEISPDTCRLWDISTHKKLDKDRFRQDLDDVLGAYQEIYHRLQTRG